MVTLPNSKFALSVSTNYHVSSRFTDQSWVIPVQLPAAFSSSDYLGGHDPGWSGTVETQHARCNKKEMARSTISRGGSRSAAER